MKNFIRHYGWMIALIVAGLALAFFFMAPPPPKKVTIAGGGAGGAYAATAAAYADTLKGVGVDAEVLTTNGSLDNLAKLKAGEADIAIVQTGLASGADVTGLQGLGAIFYEPMWVFHRAGVSVSDLRDLKGRTVAIGAEGSGVRALATLLLEEWGVALTDITALPLGGADAAAALKDGKADAAIVVTGASAAWITDLIAARDIHLLSLRQALGVSRRHPFLAPVTLPEGVLDPRRDLPEKDVQLIAPAAQIVVREGLHPAIQSLLLEAALADGAKGSVLAEPGRFPTPQLADVPLSDEAKRYYRNGPSFLRTIFPYSVANFLERAWVLAIPLLTLIVPLVRAAPPLYRWRIRRKIYVWYNDLRDLERAGREATTHEERQEVRGRLADLQSETGKVEVPVSYTDDLYRLRAHIRFVAELVDKLAAQERHARI